MSPTVSSPLAHPQTLRLALAGAGLIGQAHLRVIADNPDCALCAIVDPASAAQAQAAALGVPWYPDLDALLAHDRPDGVILATPNALHVPQALRCVAQDLPVLLEKPVATTVQEGQALLDAVQARQARVLVGHHRAHSPIMAQARQVIASGRLGRLVAVQGSATFYKPAHYFQEGPWRAQAGGGPILINMIHEVHNLRSLCGEVVAVQAFASNATRGFVVEDTVAINLRFANGVLGTFLLSDTAASARSWEQTAQENKAYASYDDEDCYVISGTRGSLSVPTMRLKTYPDEAHSSWWKPFEQAVVDLLREDPLTLQMAHFVDVIHRRTPALVSVRDGLQNLRVTEAIGQAVRSGQTVMIEQTPTGD